MEKLPILTERLFLRSPNINVCFRIKIAGNIGIKEFETAINNVCKRHPLLNCSIEIDNEHNAWFVQNATHIGIEYYKPEEMPDWQKWYKKTDAIPFDFLHGPLVKICVISDENQMEIIILGHHIIGDGIGYLNLAKDMLLALDNKLDIVPQIPPVNNKFKKGGKLGFLSKLYARKLNKEWKKNRISFSENDYFMFFEQYRSRFVPQIYINSIAETNLKKLIEKCKINNVTVNELITTAFSIAMIESQGNYPNNEIRLGVAANTRNELISNPCNCMGNYVTGISANVNYIPEQDFMSNAKNIATILRKQLNNFKTRHLIVNFLSEFDTDLIESIMFAAYGNHQLPISKRIGELIGEGLDQKGLGISNLGRHEFNNYDTFRLIDMQFIGPVFPANLLSVSIITVNNKLNICLGYNEVEIATDIVKQIYEKAIDLICNYEERNKSMIFECTSKQAQ
jgi:NRPS condensation-like uncharacterized protein